MSRSWRVLGLFALWHLTVGAPNCTGDTGGSAGGFFRGPTCGDVTCSGLQYCTDQRTCAWRPREGQPCSEWLCAPGLFCDLGWSTPRCAAAGEVGAGGECRETTDCDAELVCHADHRCGPRLGDGVACDARRELCAGDLICREWHDERHRCAAPSLEGERCVSPQDCVDGLICSAVEGRRICIPPRGLGEACAIHPDCQEGLYCAGYGGPDAVCAWERALGDACDPAAFELCTGALQCADGRCRLSEIGEACVLDDDCAEALVCAADATCISPRGPGEACGHGECAEGLECVGLGGADARCGTARTLGQTCDADAALLCTRYLHCDDGLCRAAVEGEPCRTDNHCAPELFCQQGGRPWPDLRCAPRQPAGAPCGEDLSCARDHFCSAGQRCTPR